MAARIDRITAEQEAALVALREARRAIGARTGHDAECAAIGSAAIADAYREVDAKPPSLVLWAQSPIQALLMHWTLARLAAGGAGPATGKSFGGQLKSFGGQLRSQLMSQLGGQLEGQLGSQIQGQLGDQLKDQFWGLRGQLQDQLEGQLGSKLENQLQDQLEGQLGSQLEDQLQDQLWGLWGQLWGQLGSRIAGQLGSKLAGQLRDQLGIVGQLRDQIQDQIAGQLAGQLASQLGDQFAGQRGDQLRDQLWSQLGGQLRDQFQSQLADQLRGAWAQRWCWGQCETYWIARARFAISIGVRVTADQERRLALMERLASAAFMVFSWSGVSILVEHPAVARFDTRHRLHRVDGPALAWDDGYAVYAVSGIRLSPERGVAMAAGTLTARQILDEGNAEVRRVLVETYDRGDLGRWVRDLGAEPVHADVDWMGRPRRLYQIERPGDTPYTLVQVTNSTPEPDGHRKVYSFRVDPELRPLNRADARPQELTCHNAIASGYRRYGYEYRPQIET